MSPKTSSFVVAIYIFSTIVLLPTLYYGAFALSGLGVNNPIDIYWLDLHNTTLRPLLSLLIIPLGTFVFFIVGRKRRINQKSYWFAVVFLFFVNILACGASIGGILRAHNELSRVVVDHKTYYTLLSYGTEGIGHPRPIIDTYECDQFGLFCHIIYTYECGDDCTNRWDWQVELTPDTQTQMLIVWLDKPPIYNHPISQ